MAVWRGGGVPINKLFFGVIMVIFQIIFCAEIYINDISLFFKNYF